MWYERVGRGEAGCNFTAADARTSCAAWRYIHTPSLLPFDLVTSVPFSFYDFIIYQALP